MPKVGLIKPVIGIFYQFINFGIDNLFYQYQKYFRPMPCSEDSRLDQVVQAGLIFLIGFSNCNI
jgi:hypothetical protein